VDNTDALAALLGVADVREGNGHIFRKEEQKKKKERGIRRTEEKLEEGRRHSARPI
jgi:hypothetical protein